MSRHVSARLRQVIREQFDNACAYCRSPQRLSAATFEVEHINPRTAGGETVVENLCLACPTCNRCKGERTAARDTGTGNVAPLFHPQRDDWSAHFQWSDDRSEILPLTATGRVTAQLLRLNRSAMIDLRRLWVRLQEFP